MPIIPIQDDQNASVLHIAAELDLIDALKQLLETEDGKELLDAKDRVGFRALHRAAASNAVGTLQVLIKSGASLSLQTPNGSTALHVAAASGAVEAWALLVAAGADASGTPDKWGRSAMAVAECHGWRAQGSTTSSVLVKVQNEATTQQSSSARQKKVGPYGSLTTTAILSHPLCTKHFTCPPSDTEGSSAPPENVKRITVLLDKDKGALRSSELAKDILWEPEARAAALADVLRVHEWNYIRQIQSKCEGIARDAETSDGIDNLDGDTTLSRESFAAALHAAGSVCQAVDLVAKGDQVKNAFCAVRPPGHHAGPRGLVKGEQGGPDSHGFCFLNNISIGAAYALHVHREKVKRVVIVDFDVHHGNGTEETVRWLVPGVDTHETITVTGFGTSYTPRFKPWHDAWDARNVLFVSVHGYGPREEGLEHLMPAAAFYPGSGRTVLPEAIPPPSEGISASDKTDGIISAEIFEKPAAMKKAAAAMRVGKHPAIVSSVDNENDHDDDDDEDDDDEGMGGQPMEQVQAGGDIDDEDDDDDDDEDYQNDGNADDDEEQQEDDDDDDDDEPSMPQARQPTNKVQALLQMFIPKKVTTSSSAPSSSSSSSSSMPPVSASPSPAAALLTRMDPLILDIGVRLPGESLGPEATAATSNEYRHQWRNYFRDEIFPRMMTFQPDMIFISAGFDAHKKDTINGGYIALLEEDFEWVTTNLLKIANTCCEGRVVSALEGGYQLGGEYCSSFAKSVKTHVAAMVRGGKCLESKYNQDDADKEKAIERELLDDAERRRVAKLEQQLLQQQLQQQQHVRSSLYLTIAHWQGRVCISHSVFYFFPGLEYRFFNGCFSLQGTTAIASSTRRRGHCRVQCDRCHGTSHGRSKRHRVRGSGRRGIQSQTTKGTGGLRCIERGIEKGW